MNRTLTTSKFKVTSGYYFVIPGLELSWRLASGKLSPTPASRSSSPSFSSELGCGVGGTSSPGVGTSSPPVFPDAPISPATLEIPVDELPYVVGVSDSHPFPCSLCEKSFSKLSHVKHHEQVRRFSHHNFP